VRAGLAKLGWTEAELAARKNGDKSKLKLDVKLRAETTTCLPAGRQVTLQWIAARLQMGTGASLSNLLSSRRRGQR